MKKNILATCGLLFCTSLLHAQTTEEVRIDFENQNYKSLGVYDTWHKSPFRSQNKQAAVLEGNVQVVSNIDKNYDEILRLHQMLLTMCWASSVHALAQTLSVHASILSSHSL